MIVASENQTCQIPVFIEQQHQYFPSISLLLVGLSFCVREQVWVQVLVKVEVFICKSGYLTKPVPPLPPAPHLQNLSTNCQITNVQIFQKVFKIFKISKIFKIFESNAQFKIRRSRDLYSCDDLT